MSLNDYFAANGAVYLRPVGLPDCFPMPGLSHGCKPPPLSAGGQKPRSMAAVSPLHQPLPTAPYDAGGFGAASRTSSFAAALRKLAKQAGDPLPGEKDLSQISPVSSPVLSQGSLTPKRSVPQPAAPQPIFLTNHQGSFASSSPPVVTIAPSRPLATHTSESRKVMDLSNVPQANSTSTLTNGHMQDSLGVKLDSSKGGPRPSHSEKWEDSSLSNKGLSASSASSQVRPHATIAPLPRPDDSLTSSRGFQPYRGATEEPPRNTLPHHLSLFDHHHPSYPYSPAAFLPPPPHLSHPAYRFDDPLYLERYSLLRPPMMPYPQQGMMGPPAAFYPNSRYAADLIAQSLSISSANSSILNHERLKLEEERRMREKEMELDQSRNKEQERLREKEHKEKEHKEREQQREKEKKSHREKQQQQEEEHKKGLHNSNYYSSSSSSSKRTESPSVRNPPVIHCTPTTVPSTTPLNLVVQPEPLKKETTELWMPWQQPVSNYSKDSQDSGSSSNKHQTFRPQEVHRINPTKDSHINEKVNLRFSPTILNEKKQPAEHQQQQHQPPLVSEPPKKPPHDPPKRFDSHHHHHIPDLPKDHGGGHHEWRHEKLQKACTNNHRNKSHESKKAFQPTHQRKAAANGAILKPTPYINEGMHARLIESEKCRLEMNGHATKMHLQQTLNDTRLGFKSSSQAMPPGKELVPAAPKSYSDFYSAPPMPRSNVASLTPVVSKLDLDAKNLKKNGFKYCDDDAKEERRLKNFLVLTKVPPMKFDPNPQKLKFLKLLGLTTHFKRKKIEFDMYLKRRKILREDSLVPQYSPKSEGREELFPSTVPENSARIERLTDQLMTESNPVKLEFLFKIGLTPVTLVKKEEKERIRRIVEEEKIRRHYRMLAKNNRKSSPRRLFVPKSEAALKLDHLRKMREMNSISNGLVGKRLHEDDVEMNDVKYNPSQLLLLKVEQVPYHCSSESNESQNSPPSEKPIAPYSSSHKSFNKYSFKRGHSLKSEFRFVEPNPVLKNNHSSRVHPPALDSKMDCSGTSVSTQVDPSLLGNNVDRTLTDLKNPFNWPGLEAIMEAFYRHTNEQSSEKTVLTERWQHLRQTQEDLKKEADNLTRQMSDLLRTKRELDEERQQHQHSIDHIKQCLRIGR